MEVQQLGGSRAVSLERSVAHHPHPKHGAGNSTALLWSYLDVKETLKVVSS